MRPQAPLVQLSLFAEAANLARVYPEENMWRFYRMEIWPDLLAALSRLGAAGSRTTPLAKAIRRISEPRPCWGRIYQQLSNPAADAVAAGTAHSLAAIPTFVGASTAKAALSKSREAVARVMTEALADPQLFVKLTTPIPRGATAEARFMSQLRGVLANSALQPIPNQRGSGSSAN
jgi:hypothetical protein